MKGDKFYIIYIKKEKYIKVEKEREKRLKEIRIY